MKRYQVSREREREREMYMERGRERVRVRDTKKYQVRLVHTRANGRTCTRRRLPTRAHTGVNTRARARAYTFILPVK